MVPPRPTSRRLRRGTASFYDSGWKVLLILVGAPLGFFVGLYFAVHFTFWGLTRGSEYRNGQAEFLGVLPMVGANLVLPGVGLMAGGFPLHGFAALGLWTLVLLFGLKHASLPTFNMLVVHLFAGIWASILAGWEAYRLTKEAPARPPPSVGRLNPHRQRVPTMEDPDLYPIRVEVLQRLIEAALCESPTLDAVQKAALNRMKHLLRIEDRTFGKLLRTAVAESEAGLRAARSGEYGPDAVYDRLLGQALTHRAFTDVTDDLLASAANLLGIPVRVARERRAEREAEIEANRQESRPLLSRSQARMASSRIRTEDPGEGSQARPAGQDDDPTTC